MLNNSNLPQVIYVATPERARSYKFDSSYLKMDRANIAVLSIELLKSEEYASIIPSDIHVNDVLISNPNELNSYISVERLSDHKNDKFYHYKEIAGLLGASHYSIRWAEKKQTTSTIDVKTGVKVKGKASAEFDLNKKDEAEQQLGLSIDAEWTGNGTITDESYKEALALLTKYRLEDDVSIKTLIKERSPQNKNLKKKESIRCTTSQLLNKNLDIALTLEYNSMLEISASVKRALEEREETSLEIEFVFPN